ncbi:MAG: 50S ribosomal protein L9 [Syntrophomonadaceae bacterium]|nr:50S ribosomal protein L9 [Syntrophomonadaceae bacterium]
MKVILLENVPKLGEKGKIIEVADGYGRNYLLPRGLAEEATAMKMKESKEKEDKKARQHDREQAAAQALKERIDGATVKVAMKTGGGDKLYGAVTNAQVAEILQKEFKVNIDKKKIEIPEAIKHTGEFTVKIKLFTGIQAEVKLNVTSE